MEEESRINIMVLSRTALREKGQDIIEYALLLAIIVGIGFLIYDQSRMGSSIRTVFNNAGNLMENAAGSAESSETAFPDSIGEAIRNGSLHLDENTFIYSDAADSQDIARSLGIPFSEGDAWTIGRTTGGNIDDYVLIYYSAASNGGIPVSHYQTSWTVNSSGSITSHSGPSTMVPASYYAYQASTGEADNDYAHSSYFPENGTQVRVVIGPSGNYTIR